jgi:2-polyprenyl-6-methoxyphenol hydroxylase-like FAD-dependent oxidoreductase
VRDPAILIVGAGPTGLTLALWLTKLGIRARIIDKNAEPAAYSRALGVQARTLELYAQLGDLADTVVAKGVKVEGINLWARGRKAARVPFENVGEGLTPFPFVLTFAQDQHERLLIDRLADLGVTVEHSTELVALKQSESAVIAEIRHADGSQERSEFAYLAGCDGAHSIVRQASGIGFGGGTYSHLFYVADVDATGPAVDNDIHVDLDESDLLAIFPMTGKNRVRLVGTIPDDTVKDENTFGFADVSRRPIEQMKLDIVRVNWFSTYRVHHRIADRFRDGRAFLLGDAAHVHSPVGAQGMNTGIGDSVNLAWKLADVLNHRATDDLLETYALERMAFARRLVATTDRAFTIASKPGPIAQRVRTIIVPRLLPLLFRFRFLRRYLFRTVSQIEIRYPTSPLSAGKAGRIRGGDRLPWIRTESDGDNFAPLRSLTWQAHVYGEPATGLADVCSRFEIPLTVFAWKDAMQKAGVWRGAIYLVRPDGYVALADHEGDPTRLRDYCAQHRITSAP